MDKYTHALLTVLKDKFVEITGKTAFQTTGELRAFYLQELNDNLYRQMDSIALDAYIQGSGGEISSGKMNALRSSSAFTYNLFWNRIANIVNAQSGSPIGNGSYSVEFEKKFHTLKLTASRAPANLDAFLYCADTCEAIACEMKMMEWIFNSPSTLRSAYLKPENYINPEAGKVFVDVARELTAPEAKQQTLKDYPCRASRYDAFQMFKHTVACYTACVSEEKRPLKKLTLVNCAWTLSTPEVLEEPHRERYLHEEKTELAEFEQFRRSMLPVKALFAAQNVDFDICFYTFNDFVAMLDKTAEEREYLRRYTM